LLAAVAAHSAQVQSALAVLLATLAVMGKQGTQITLGCLLVQVALLLPLAVLVVVEAVAVEPILLEPMVVLEVMASLVLAAAAQTAQGHLLKQAVQAVQE
jgi:hypothetical protein